MNTDHQLCDGEVHLYCSPLPHSPPELSRLEHLLSTSETDRAGLLKDKHAKIRYIAGRGMLREILGGYLGVLPGKVQIAAGMHGKPYLVDGAEYIRFNLSHSGDVMLLAVSANVEVGVDIESMVADRPLKDMARIAFSLREQEELFSLPSGDLQTKAFYRIWTRKEACLKACGRGFSLLNNSFDVNFSTEEPLHAVCCNQSFWHVLDLNVPHPYCAALAAEATGSSKSPPKIVWHDTTV
ncbi:MAG: 4'-phosphopantetheinyl transferase superfamily protein [Geobacteraceae bacterium]|nr:4'-phosphopantetheinyl transferase superfamily protein [Geobacteraceae bacterium]